MSDNMLLVRDTLAKMTRYQQKAVGVDMNCKAAVYTLRLIVAMNPNNTDLCTRLNALVGAITEGRMLANQWKYFQTGKQFVHALGQRGKMPPALWFFSTMAFMMRTMEQLWGDCGLVCKRWRHDWSLPAISTKYKFYKSWGLLCSAICELIKIVALRHRIRYIKGAGSTTTGVSSPITNSPILRSKFPTSDSNNKDDKEKEMEEGSEEKENDKETEGVRTSEFEITIEINEAHRQMQEHALLLLRNICDMIIYFQWIESYRPNKTLQALCGMYSGFFGIYLVWKGTA